MRSILLIIGLVFLYASFQNVRAQNTPNLPDSSDLKPSFSGFLRVEGGLFESSRNPGRMPSRRFLVTGNPQMRIGEWNVMTNFQLGNFEDQLRQPFNKIGISPSYKWITVHLGHHQQSFSEFTYHNHLLFGGGVELNPGKLRLALLYGNLLRSSQGGLALNNEFARPYYQRRGFISKIGVGSSDNFVDLIILSGQDNPDGAGDFRDSLRIYPEENVVLGLHTEQVFAKNFRLLISGALSAYTLDRRSSELENDPFFGDDLLYSVFTPRISSQYLGAGMVTLEYRKKGWIGNIAYKLIQPGFQSMGAYFNQSDLSKISLNAQGRAFKNKLGISANYRNQRNNVFNTRTSENKQNYFGTQLNWMQASSWNALLAISYFSSVQNLLTDTLPNAFGFEQGTFQTNGQFTKRRTEGGEHYSFQLLFMNRKDRIANRSAYNNITVRGTYTHPLGDSNMWSLRPELSLARFEIAALTSTWRISPAASLLFKNSDKQITGRLSAVPTLEFLENTDDRFSMRTSLDVSKRIKRKHRFSLRVNQSFSSGGYSYNEWRLNVSYQYSL